MKAFSTIAILVVTTFLSAASGATRYVVAMPRTSARESSDIFKAFVGLTLEAKPGDQIQVIDAQTLERIVSVNVQDSVSIQNRARQMAASMTEVRQYFKSANNQCDQIRLPQILSEIATLPRGDYSETRLIVFGSMYYQDARDAAAFSEGLVPTDGSILATSAQSVYGAADRHHLLRDIAVDFCAMDASESSELHRRAVERFWGIFIQQLGGVMATFDSSPNLTVERSLSGNQTPVVTSDIDRNDIAIGIRRVVEPVRNSISDSDASALSSLTTQPTHRATDSVAATDDVMTIGAVWNSDDGGQADVDLYVKSGPNNQELYYGNQECPGGKYLRDIQHSTSNLTGDTWQSDWEVVQLSSVSLNSLDIWVDLYEKHSNTEVCGIVRAQFHGRIVDVPFHITGPGDKGTGRTSRENNENWVHISLANAFAPSPSQ